MISTNRIHSSSVFLVSGGSKGITAECVIRLSQQYRCKFILLGRSEIVESEPDFAQGIFDESTLKKRIMEHLVSQGETPKPMNIQKVFNKISSSREIKKNLTRIKQAGGQAEYLSVDVTDTRSLEEKLASVVKILGSITGIIHGAGNLADKVIEKKTRQDFETVYTAKVKGLENLLSCVNINQLEYLILFSSTAGFYGNIGQTDYAIANEILNKSAHLIKQQYPNCHVVAINWGPWESGMVTPQLKKAFAERNIDIIPIEVGTQILVNELDPANKATTQIVVSGPAPSTVLPLDPELRTYRIRRELTLEANPFLEHHIVGGYPVLPTVCAMSWMINTCENLYPGYRMFNCTDFKVLKGIIFQENIAKEYFLDVEEISKNELGEIECMAKIWSFREAKKITYHFSGRLKLLPKIPSPIIYQDLANFEYDQLLAGNITAIYQEWKQDQKPSNKDMVHGSSFTGRSKYVKKFSEQKFTIESRWPGIKEKQQGQFPVQWFNPYTADMSFHPLGIHVQMNHQGFALPTSIEKYEQFASLKNNEPFYITTEFKEINDRVAIADIITHNFQGEVFSRTLGMKFVIWSKTNSTEKAKL